MAKKIQLTEPQIETASPRVAELLNTQAVLSIRVPRFEFQKVATHLMEVAADQGKLPGELRRQTWRQLTGTNYE
ncbi:hypothetical protein [Lentilactobacillus senioris]|uniref:Uncharacterized protein n=1 Tax=Lentilactobacillus senioris DSM 24302 = JCM 17472 TaxID=1423802 RepID=A0A0R2D083_9LACO|nr:hypothetical protein [Lentilactobacillus senioris]KRM93356.1 hypothetical protein FC56_GL001023 [Lentilactobacillus senioris DSM 24302 = JCM 17472]